MAKLVYSFMEGDGKNKKLLGGKGANLCEMTQIGINVPPGFVITPEASLEYLDAGALPESLMAEVDEQVHPDVDDRDDQHAALHHGYVPREEGVEKQRAQACPLEDLLGHHCAREQRSELSGADGDHGEKRVSKRVSQQ